MTLLVRLGLSVRLRETVTEGEAVVEGEDVGVTLLECEREARGLDVPERLPLAEPL